MKWYKIRGHSRFFSWLPRNSMGRREKEEKKKRKGLMTNHHSKHHSKQRRGASNIKEEADIIPSDDDSLTAQKARSRLKCWYVLCMRQQIF